MRWGKATLLAFLLLVGPDGPSIAQQVPPRLRTEVEMVLVDVIVRDEKGKPVPGLKRSDFQVWEEGRPQEIAYFQEAGLVIPQDDFSGEGRSGQGAPAGEGEKIILVVDQVSVDSASLVRVRQALEAFFREIWRSRDQVMLVELGEGFRVVVPFTRDRSRLLQGVDEIRPAGHVAGELDQAAVEEKVEQAVLRRLQDPRGNSVEEAIEAGAHEIRTYLNQVLDRAAQGLRALTALARSLQHLEGRKSVLLLSQGFPIRPSQTLKRIIESTIDGLGIARDSRIRETVRRETAKIQDPNLQNLVSKIVSEANQAGTTFYTVDARGLRAVAPGGSAADRGGFANLISGQSVIRQLKSLADAREFLGALAYGTGGMAFFNRNDLENLLALAYDDSRTYYLLGYVPDKKGKGGDFREIRVEVACPACEVRFRRGYTVHSPSERRQALISNALTFPELYPGRQLQWTASCFLLGRDQAKVYLSLGIPTRDVLFERRQEHLVASLTFYGIIRDEGGRPLGKELDLAKGFQLKFSPQEYQELVDQNLRTTAELELPPGKYELTVVAHNPEGAQLWVNRQELPMPEAREGRLRMSSLVLSQELIPAQGRQSPLVFQGRLVAPSPDLRFSRWGSLFVYFQIYEPGRGSRDQTDLVVELRVKSPAGETLTKAALPIRESVGGRWPVLSRGASLPLTPYLPGTYELSVEVFDRIRNQKVAGRSIFHIVEEEAQ